MADDGKDAGSWWKTLPGILTGIGSTLAALAALVAALSQAGLLGEKKSGEAKLQESPPVRDLIVATTAPAVDPPPAAAQAHTPRQPPEPELPTAPTSAGRSLFSRLAQANIHNSVGDTTMKKWLADNEGGYRRLAEASLAVLGGRVLTGQGVDLDVVSFVYVKSLGIAGDDLPARHQVRLPLLRSAMVQAHADKNGSVARSFDEIVK